MGQGSYCLECFQVKISHKLVGNQFGGEEPGDGQDFVSRHPEEEGDGVENVANDKLQG